MTMGMPLWRRAWQSPTLTSWTALGVRVSSLSLLLPLVLNRLSPAEIVVWQIFATVTTLTLILDFGLSPTAIRFFAYAHGDNAEGRIGPAALFVRLRQTYRRMILVSFALLATAGTAVVYQPIMNTGHPETIWFAWASVLIATPMGFVANMYGSSLQGLGSIVLLRRWETLAGAVQILATIAAVLLGGGLTGLVIVYNAAAILTALGNRLMTRRAHPEMFAEPAAAEQGAELDLWGPMWRSGVGVLMSQGLIQSGNVVVAHVFAPTAAASYLIAVRIITTISQFSQAPFYSKIPEMASRYAAGRRDMVLGLARKGMQRALLTYAVGALLVSWFGGILLELIHSRTAFPPQALWIPLVLAFFLERYGAMHLQLHSVSNDIKWHVANGATGLAMVILAWILLQTWPEPGALPVAMLLAYGLVYVPYSVTQSRRCYAFQLLAFERNAAAPSAALLILGLTLSSAFVK